jgi:hypothetical protein
MTHAIVRWDEKNARRADASFGDDSQMTIAGRSVHSHEPVPDHEQKQVALAYLRDAWADAKLDGVDGDCLAQACLFAAFAEFVTTYGEEAAAGLADRLGARIRNGEFSIEQPRQ